MPLIYGLVDKHTLTPSFLSDLETAGMINVDLEEWSQFLREFYDTREAIVSMGKFF